jgi:hypothetical protein
MAIMKLILSPFHYFKEDVEMRNFPGKDIQRRHSERLGAGGRREGIYFRSQKQNLQAKTPVLLATAPRKTPFLN